MGMARLAAARAIAPSRDTSLASPSPCVSKDVFFFVDTVSARVCVLVALHWLYPPAPSRSFLARRWFWWCCWMGAEWR